jgi:hypothetical protein
MNLLEAPVGRAEAPRRRVKAKLSQQQRPGKPAFQNVELDKKTLHFVVSDFVFWL